MKITVPCPASKWWHTVWEAIDGDSEARDIMLSSLQYFSYFTHFISCFTFTKNICIYVQMNAQKHYQPLHQKSLEKTNPQFRIRMRAFILPQSYIIFRPQSKRKIPEKPFLFYFIDQCPNALWIENQKECHLHTKTYLVPQTGIGGDSHKTPARYAAVVLSSQGRGGCFTWPESP